VRRRVAGRRFSGVAGTRVSGGAGEGAGGRAGSSARVSCSPGPVDTTPAVLPKIETSEVHEINR
jgi:hypothetical protein